MNIEKMKAFAQAQRESEESTEIRPAPKPAEPEYQPEAIYIPIEDDEPSEMPDDRSPQSVKIGERRGSSLSSSML